ncbi:hypothetical protein RRG08_039008 [Elysia crispata]|uniref:Uncharacterized protein n=1 Tax=Elysia crispata TaxID=231223 RepID=A0AAE1AUL9_9GAST|nr:hypothetical protein RRG08_039008 [Elysia crispata]
MENDRIGMEEKPKTYLLEKQFSESRRGQRKRGRRTVKPEPPAMRKLKCVKSCAEIILYDSSCSINPRSSSRNGKFRVKDATVAFRPEPSRLDRHYRDDDETGAEEFIFERHQNTPERQHAETSHPPDCVHPALHHHGPGFTPLAFHTPVCSYKTAGTDADLFAGIKRPHPKPGGGAPFGHLKTYKCGCNMQTALLRLSTSAMTDQKFKPLEKPTQGPTNTK